MKHILVIGGTRNIGHQLVLRLLDAGHDVTTLNRGIGQDNLPDSVHRLRADRTDHQQMRRALMARHFDVVVDMVMYKGEEAESIVDLLSGQVGHYIFLSSGQVYLVREDIERPFREEDYTGRLLPPPKENTYAYEEWFYGMGKRNAEDTFAQAWQQTQFPSTALRLPMVNSKRDPFKRLYNYILRLKDGGPVLVPETPRFNLRHIYAPDVVRIVMQLIDQGPGPSQAYNISQDESVSIDEFLDLLGDILHVQPHIVRLKRSELVAAGLLPDCSPFSERWMSEMDNSRSKAELGISYTPLRDYLVELVDFYEKKRPSPPISYKRRRAELRMVGALDT